MGLQQQTPEKLNLTHIPRKLTEEENLCWVPHATYAYATKTARPTNCPSSANLCTQCTLELTLFHWLAQGDILAVVCYTQGAWPQWGQHFPWIQLLGKVFLTRHLHGGQKQSATQSRTFACYRQRKYTHLPRATGECLIERHELSCSQYGADIINPAESLGGFVLPYTFMYSHAGTKIPYQGRTRTWNGLLSPVYLKRSQKSSGGNNTHTFVLFFPQQCWRNWRRLLNNWIHDSVYFLMRGRM